jgi:hypothetical protein
MGHFHVNIALSGSRGWGVGLLPQDSIAIEDFRKPFQRKNKAQTERYKEKPTVDHQNLAR